MNSRSGPGLTSRSVCAVRAIVTGAPTMVSVLVLALVASVALTHRSFEAPAGHPNGVVQGPGAAASAQTPAVLSPLRERVTRPQRRALVFLVGDRLQASALLQTYGTLEWDRDPFDPYYNLRAPSVHCLVAGTPEEKTTAIQQLNVMLTQAASQRVDLSVIDLRSKGAAAGGREP